jgi:hypothetical protein
MSNPITLPEDEAARHQSQADEIADFMGWNKPTPAPLVYSSDVPTVPGYYWERRQSGERILELPTFPNTWPKHYTERRASLVSGLRAIGSTPSDLAEVEALPDTSFLIEWAGPIPRPSN